MLKWRRKSLEKTLAEFEAIVAGYDDLKFKTRAEMDAAGAEIVNWMIREPKPEVSVTGNWLERAGQLARAEGALAASEKRKIADFVVHRNAYENYEQALRVIPQLKRELSH